MQPNLFLGWWRDPDGVEHLDLVQIFEAKITALLAAYFRGETSIYDFSNDAVIDCSYFYTTQESEE